MILEFSLIISFGYFLLTRDYASTELAVICPFIHPSPSQGNVI